LPFVRLAQVQLIASSSYSLLAQSLGKRSPTYFKICA